MLTDYEALPEFVPNLVLCERLPLPKEAASRMVRLRQVPCWPAHLPSSGNTHVTAAFGASKAVV